MSGSNYPPGVSGNEPEIAGDEEEERLHESIYQDCYDIGIDPISAKYVWKVGLSIYLVKRGRLVIKIEKCSDPSAWYAEMVGQRMAVERFEICLKKSQGIPEDVYWCRETGRFNCINYVRISDATPC